MKKKQNLTQIRHWIQHNPTDSPDSVAKRFSISKQVVYSLRSRLRKNGIDIPKLPTRGMAVKRPPIDEPHKISQRRQAELLKSDTLILFARLERAKNQYNFEQAANFQKKLLELGVDVKFQPHSTEIIE